LWILRTGVPWRDLPIDYGIHSTVSSRFYRWRKAGIWDEILTKLQTIADADRAYSSQNIRQKIRLKGATPIIP
jgi:transposase